MGSGETMKRIFLLLLSLLVIVVAYGLKGGALQIIFVAKAVIPLLLCTILGTLFSFKLSEIISAFRDAFNEEAIQNNTEVYKLDRLVIRNISSVLAFWTSVIVVLGIVTALSNISDMTKLGLELSSVFTVLTLGLIIKALLLIPMEISIKKKLILTRKIQDYAQ